MIPRCALLLLIASALHAPELPPPESLLIQGAPPVPAELAAAVGRYTNARAADLQTWSPVRREMLIVTRFGDTVQVHRVSAPGGDRRQITFYDDNVGRGIAWEPRSGDAILFNKDSGGDGNFQIYRLDARTETATLVTDGKSRNSVGVWARAGKRIAYMSSRRNGKDSDLYVVEPARPDTNRLVAQLEGGFWSPLSWSPDDRRILIQQRTSESDGALWIADAATGALTKVYAGGIGGAFSGANRIVTTSAGFSEFRELVRVDVRSGKATRLTAHIPWDVLEFDLASDGRTCAIVTNEAGSYTLHVLDAVTGRERRLPKRMPRGYVTNVRWRPGSEELGFGIETAGEPTDAYSIDFATNAVTRWTRSETGGVATASFAEAEPIRWRSFDGRDMTGFLYRPPPRFTGKRPVLISIHGGPADEFTPYYLGSWNYLLDQLGVALVFPNIRGSSGFGKSFLDLDNGMHREDALRDLGALLDWIAARPDLDAGRVAVHGVSYGGYMTLSVAAAYADRIRGAIDIVGPTNLVTFLETTAEYRRDLRRVEYGDERDPAMRAFLDRIAPTTNAGKITKPLLVFQGANDPAVPVAETERIVAAVRKNQTPVWYVLAKDEGHGFRKRRNSDYQLYLIVVFLQQLFA
ncbi:MAG TPA: prolyl oligopeptidase family serine peptidase [Thermoanaerobaculia bacterium]|nr:prolyl oligopeptidase family serine peptidase [Thermoanaerobaculia bacterium]